MIQKKIKQQGISLPISLIILIGVLLTSAILIRASESSVNTVGNIGHRNMLQNANDAAFSQAQNWLSTNSSILNNDNSQAGYFSSISSNDIDYTNLNNWQSAMNLGADELGNTSQYLIFRLCSLSNASPTDIVSGTSNNCASKSSGNGSGNSTGYQNIDFGGGPQIFYKILVRTQGPKGALSISETIVSL